MICYPDTAGASRYPVFGRITKKTPTGRFRITFLRKLRPPCARNTSDMGVKDAGYTGPEAPERRVRARFMGSGISVGSIGRQQRPAPRLCVETVGARHGIWDQFDNGD